MYVAAIIPAAGTGRRMGMGRNKAFLPLQGKPILVHTLDVLGQCSIIDEIVVAVGEDDLDWCRRELSYLLDVDVARCQFVAGGTTRQESVRRCLLAADPHADIFLVHDAVRPLVTPEIVQSAVLAADDTGAAACAVPTKDTVRISHDGEVFSCTPDRSSVWLIQTPQVFSAELLRAAHQWAAEREFVGTDDACLVEQLGQRVAVVMGSYENIKITTREDLALAEAILELRKGDENRAGARDDASQSGHDQSIGVSERRCGGDALRGTEAAGCLRK
jgi:2-C-methyl-D-erythritol 4-phosphate cytidylyltransferase